MERDEERILVDWARGGDMAAFEKLLSAHEKYVYTIAYKMLQNREDAEDASQETFLKAYTGLDSFRGESKFSVWLYRIAANVCTDMLRRRTGVVVSLQSEEDGEETELPLPDLRYAPETELEKKELREAVSRAMEQLPEDYRRTLVLRELGGQSYEEIGRILRLEPGTVKSRLFRARKKMCALLLESGNFFGPAPSKPEKGGAGK